MLILGPKIPNLLHFGHNKNFPQKMGSHFCVFIHIVKSFDDFKSICKTCDSTIKKDTLSGSM